MRASGYLILIFAGVLLSGCVGDKAEYVHSVWRGPDAADTPRSVYFVTDRERDKDWPGGFGKHWANALSCGTAVAVIPPLNQPDEPTGRLDVAQTARIECGADAGGIAGAIASGAEAGRCRSVLIYVHGFNTLFDGALLRAGQIALDTRWSCVAAVFSWASEGEVGRYVADIEHSAYAAPELEAVLRALAARNIRVSIVAHSIGTRVTLAALSSMAKHGGAGSFIDELVLAAADVGADPVNNDFARLLLDARPFARRITVYASAGDAVLAVSAVAHGEVPRAGRRPLSDRRLQDHQVDVVDATDAPAELLGHSYFAMSSEAVSDIAQALDGAPIAQRGTLVCRAPRGDGPCEPSLPHYVLIVAPERRPDFLTRLVRHVVPLLPRIELAPLTGSSE